MPTPYPAPGRMYPRVSLYVGCAQRTDAHVGNEFKDTTILVPKHLKPTYNVCPGYSAHKLLGGHQWY